ncbi:hypothetical protein [Streptomyces sp. NPDC051286]|uniref:hypothetical protein n=1 Tax=Streptomyces sp. NPDC051286 TaxID=3365647 RepID=UPI0037B55601
MTELPSGRAELPGPARQSAQDLAKQLRTEVAQVSGVAPAVSSDIGHARAGDIVPGRTTLYAHGERVGTVDASIPLPLRSIGTEKAGLRGDLDEVTTWDEALSPEQVRSDYAHYDR